MDDRLTADIDIELDAELLATASTVGVSDLQSSTKAPVQAGDLAEVEVAWLLGRAFQEVWTGLLVVRGREGERAIQLADGRPVYATSSLPEDRLAEILRRQGRLDASQRSQVARLSSERGRRTGAVLVDLGLLKPMELLPALRAQHEQIIVSALSPTEGSFRFDPRVQVDPGRARWLRHPAVLVREAVRGGYPEPRLRRHLGAARTVFSLVRGPDARELMNELALEPAEREVLGWFDGVRSLEEVARASGRSEEGVLGLVFPLGCFGLLAPLSRAHRAGRRSFDQKVDRDRVLALFALVQDADYFQILGLDRDAGVLEVVRAHRRLSQEVSPQALAPEVVLALAQEVQVVRQVLAEAVRVLTDETLRPLYREHLAPPAGRRA